MHKSLRLASLFVTAVLTSAGCGGSQQNCDLKALSVTPSSATGDHALSSPGNQVQFFAGPVTKGQCATAACVNCWGQTWTVSDPVNVSISNNANDNGTAICLGTTNGVVTVTASAPVASKSTQTVTGTATLTVGDRKLLRLRLKKQQPLHLTQIIRGAIKNNIPSRI